jgi:hypothetical protein
VPRSAWVTARTKPACARVQRFFEDVLIEIERRENQNPSAVVVGEDVSGRLKTVQLGHPDVHQRYVEDAQ